MASSTVVAATPTATAQPVVPTFTVTATAAASTPDASAPVCSAEVPLLVRDPPPLAASAGTGALVVVGRVSAVLSARWTTPDESRPANPAAEGFPDAVSIVTPVVLALEEPPLVNRTDQVVDGATVVVLLEAGTVGLDCVDYHVPWNRLEVGGRVLLALDARGMGSTGTPLETAHGPGWWVDAKWSITANDMATREWNGSQMPEPLRDVIAAFRDADSSSAGPTAVSTSAADGGAPATATP